LEAIIDTSHFVTMAEENEVRKTTQDVKLTNLQIDELYILLNKFPHDQLSNICANILGSVDKIPTGLFIQVPFLPTQYLNDFRLALEKFTPQQLEQLKSELTVPRNVHNKSLVRFTKIPLSRWKWFGQYTFGWIDENDEVCLMIQNGSFSFFDWEDDRQFQAYLKNGDKKKNFPHMTLKTYYQKVDPVLKTLSVEVQQEWTVVKECYKQEK
jgi:hypothetical protein